MGVPRSVQVLDVSILALYFLAYIFIKMHFEVFLILYMNSCVPRSGHQESNLCLSVFLRFYLVPGTLN